MKPQVTFKSPDFFIEGCRVINPELLLRLVDMHIIDGASFPLPDTLEWEKEKIPSYLPASTFAHMETEGSISYKEVIRLKLKSEPKVDINGYFDFCSRGYLNGMPHKDDVEEYADAKVSEYKDKLKKEVKNISGTMEAPTDAESDVEYEMRKQFLKLIDSI